MWFLTSASPSDQLHAGQINGFHPTLKRIKNKSKGKFVQQSFKTSAEFHVVTFGKLTLTKSSLACADYRAVYWSAGHVVYAVCFISLY